MNNTIHSIRRPVWASNRHTGSKTGAAFCCPRCTMWMIGTSTSTCCPSSGKAPSWSNGWAGPGSSTCCQSSLCSQDWSIWCWRPCWQSSPRTSPTAWPVLLASQVQTNLQDVHWCKTLYCLCHSTGTIFVNTSDISRCPICSEGAQSPLPPRRCELRDGVPCIQSLC